MEHVDLTSTRLKISGKWTFFEVSEASEESEDSWWPERPTPQQVRSSVFFLGGNFLELVFGGPQVVLFFLGNLLAMLGNRYARLDGLDHKGASLWGAVDVQRSSNGFAEFPGEIPRSLKIFEGVFVWTFC